MYIVLITTQLGVELYQTCVLWAEAIVCFPLGYPLFFALGVRCWAAYMFDLPATSCHAEENCAQTGQILHWDLQCYRPATLRRGGGPKVLKLQATLESTFDEFWSEF